MATVDRHALREFLDDNGCQATQQVMATLEPFFKIAEGDKYPLAPADELNQEKVRQYIGIVANKQVENITCISLSKYSSRPSWMPIEEHKCNAWVSFWVGLGNNLWDHLQGMNRTTFWVHLRKMVWESFSTDLRTIIWGSTQFDLQQKLEASFGKDFWGLIGLSIFYFVGFSLINKTEEAKKLEVMLEVLQKCIPLDFKKSDPETLEVLVA